jgi:hypothetical protein
MEVKAKSRRGIKSFCFFEDLKFSVSLSNKFEVLALSKPSKVVEAMNREDPKLRLSNEKCKKALLLGSSLGKVLHVQLHSTLGDEYAVSGIFKPSAALDDVRDRIASSKHLIKEDHVIIV